MTGLSPKAAERVAREAATQSYDPAAKALNLDWGTSLDGKQVQRWAMALGQAVLGERQKAVEDYERGHRPRGPKNDAPLLVIEMDGGRVQGREINPETGKRWKEDKVVSVSSMMPGDGKDRPPQVLVTSYQATMGDSRALGKLAVVEAERRGLRQAEEVVVLGDEGNWIDSVWKEHFPLCRRIADYSHAVEHLHAAARAVHPSDDGQRHALAERLEERLWNGRVAELVGILDHHSHQLGPPREHDGPDEPRRVLHQNVGYFQRHGRHMNYPEYRRRGWPIASGIIESGVKQFGKRVKGTEQFWNPQGVEPILALRALWLSTDERWTHYWQCPPPLAKAA